jgi:hypothetical protein
MTTYNVHIYREMRLTFQGIEAETPNVAASIARDKPTSDADDINDCEGITLAAHVDEVGDTEYERSKTIDFENEQLRNAAPELLEALEYTDSQLSDFKADALKNLGLDVALNQIRTAIAKTKAA